MSRQRIDEVLVDRGYRGHGESLSEVYISGQKRGITTQRLKRSLKRRQAIEPIIGHLKSDGLLGRNYLKGTLGDQMNVLLCCSGHNLRLILKRLRFFCLDFGCRYAVGRGQIASSRKSIPVHDGYSVDQQIRSRLNCFQPQDNWVFQGRLHSQPALRPNAYLRLPKHRYRTVPSEKPTECKPDMAIL